MTVNCTYNAPATEEGGPVLVAVPISRDMRQAELIPLNMGERKTITLGLQQTLPTGLVLKVEYKSSGHIVISNSVPGSFARRLAAPAFFDTDVISFLVSYSSGAFWILKNNIAILEGDPDEQSKPVGALFPFVPTYLAVFKADAGTKVVVSTREQSYAFRTGFIPWEDAPVGNGEIGSGNGFNPATISNGTLSNSNRTFTNNNDTLKGNVLSYKIDANTKNQVDIQIGTYLPDTVNPGGTLMLIGLKNPSNSDSIFIAFDDTQMNPGFTGNAVLTASASGSPPGEDDVVTMHVDHTTGKVWFSVNNVPYPPGSDFNPGNGLGFGHFPVPENGLGLVAFSELLRKAGNSVHIYSGAPKYTLLPEYSQWDQREFIIQQPPPPTLGNGSGAGWQFGQTLSNSNRTVTAGPSLSLAYTTTVTANSKNQVDVEIVSRTFDDPQNPSISIQLVQAASNPSGGSVLLYQVGGGGLSVFNDTNYPITLHYTNPAAPALVVGDVVTYIVNHLNGKVWVAINNVLLQGNPATDSNPVATFSVQNSTLALNTRVVGSNGNSYVMNIYTGAARYSFPVSYNSWDNRMLSAAQGPSDFNFVNQTNVPLNSVRTSNQVTLTGLTTSVPISISGTTSSQYSLNGGAYTNASGSVTNNTTLTLRHTSSSGYGATLTSTINVNGVVKSFSSSTQAPPSGGGGGCVYTRSYLKHDTQAFEGVEGTVIYGFREDEEVFENLAIVSTRTPEDQPCIRILTAAGPSVICSKSTPITLEGRRACYAEHLEIGEKVPVRIGDESEQIFYSEVIRIEDLGMMPVSLINVGGHCFAAGEQPGLYVYTHNMPTTVKD